MADGGREPDSSAPETSVRTSTSRVRDQRWTDREFRQLTRQLRPGSPVTRSWRGGPLDAADVRVTAHDDRRSVPTAAAAAGSVLLAVLAIVTGDPALASAMALVGIAACSLLGTDQARTSVTVTQDGRVEVANGVHRRVATVPVIAVARVVVPAGAPGSRWDPRRRVGELVLHTGERLVVRTLAHDPSRELDHDRAVWLGRSVLRALEVAGASLDTRRV